MLFIAALLAASIELAALFALNALLNLWCQKLHRDPALFKIGACKYCYIRKLRLCHGLPEVS